RAVVTSQAQLMAGMQRGPASSAIIPLVGLCAKSCGHYVLFNKNQVRLILVRPLPGNCQAAVSGGGGYSSRGSQVALRQPAAGTARIGRERSMGCQASVSHREYY